MNRLVVDGTVFHLQARGGISSLYQEILPRMCEIEPSLQIFLITEYTPRQLLPSHSRIIHKPIPQIESYLRPNRVWGKAIPQIREWLKYRAIGNTQDKIWHSTAYTTLRGWKGAQVVTVYDMIFELYPQVFPGDLTQRSQRAKRQSISQADALICISGTTKQDLINWYHVDERCVTVIPLACASTFSPMDGENLLLPQDIQRPFVLYVGNRRHHKNFDTLAKAFSIWARRKEFDLVTVGGRVWSEAELRTLCELGIADQVRRLSSIDDEMLCMLYNKAEAFIYPSLYEGFGIPLLEAMSCGCPIVASRIPSTLEVAGQVPYYFEPSSAEDLIQALDFALTEGRQSERVSLGLERVRQYSWDKTAAQTLAVYKDLS